MVGVVADEVVVDADPVSALKAVAAAVLLRVLEGRDDQPEPVLEDEKG